MNYLILLLPLLIGNFVVGFGRLIEYGPHSGGFITLLIVMVMMAEVIKAAREQRRLWSTLGLFTMSLVVVNFAAFFLECAINYALASEMTYTYMIEGREVIMPSYVALYIGFIYMVPRGLITWYACRLFKRRFHKADTSN